MKDHPEEFLMRRKWDELIEHYGEYFTKDELEAYKAARSEMMRDLFNEAVLKRLAGEEDDEGQSQPSTAKYKAQERYSQGWTDPRAIFGQAIAKQEGQLVNNSSLAAQQNAYHAAIQQRLYSEQQGLLQTGSTRLFGL
jgi:hypothetical protein